MIRVHTIGTHKELEDIETRTDQECTPKARSRRQTPPDDSLAQSPRSPVQRVGWWNSETQDGTQPESISTGYINRLHNTSTQ